jgi:protein gp37
MIFVNSMSDLFGEFVPESFIDRVFEVMRSTPRHTYQILTKRADRLASWTAKNPWLRDAKHIWMGVSVEDRRFGLPRIPLLRSSIAGLKFLSVEPLIESLGKFNLDGIDWVIVGGESGHGARPMKAEWARSVRDQCVRSGVPFFFKQWGGFRKALAGRLLDGREWNEFPIVTGVKMHGDEARMSVGHESKRKLLNTGSRRASGSMRRTSS